MYAVIGASGNTGSAVAQTLLKLGKPVRAVVRRPQAGAGFRNQGADVAVADLADPNALATALTGVDGAYVMTPPLLEAQDPNGTKRAFIGAIRSAAEQAGAPPLVVLSSMGAHHPSGTGPVVSLHELEQALHDYPGSVSFLRAPYFLDNWIDALEPATEKGVFPSLMAPGIRIDMASTAEIGRTAVQLLLDTHVHHRVVELRSANRYSAQDVALDLARLLGKHLEVVYPPRSEWNDILTGAGLSQLGAAQMAELIDNINAGRIGFSGEGEYRTASEGPAAMFGRLLEAKAT
ncbi:MAG TPA: NmrA family NAD(P)-binding protein [Noviherbaspirillum sp.]|uniref:NmrA family NAD(P)-binding protein n=1 Tax=Noviherbaspirillum sp. TaxID=1926288 RepID=UPI002D4DA128|nr:NmrA family NAD(P)-binding protein [Noviherbaspirillum sp.]HYD96553.1 NmrA family NAD(P)-binding protein [Noviherbaspirillum sp.]